MLGLDADTRKYPSPSPPSDDPLTKARKKVETPEGTLKFAVNHVAFGDIVE